MKHKEIVNNLIRLLAYWHYKIEKPLKKTQKYPKISYESYFCLVTLGKFGPLTMSEIAKNYAPVHSFFAQTHSSS